MKLYDKCGHEWVLVPSELTTKMWAAMSSDDDQDRQWQAVIAAAPEFEGRIAESDETIRQLRARLDEYEQAPTVAVVEGKYGLNLAYRYPFSDKPPSIGTELIARPTRKDGE